MLQIVPTMRMIMGVLASPAPRRMAPERYMKIRVKEPTKTTLK